MRTGVRPEPPCSEARPLRSGPRLWTPPLITGLYVALVTVLLPFVQQAARGDARVVAIIVVAGAILNGLVLPRLDGAGRQVLITGFLTACVVAWSLGRSALSGHRLDPWLGVCGSLGWATFAMTWARPNPSAHAGAASLPTSNRLGVSGAPAKLQPKGALPRVSVLVGTLGTVAGACLPLLPWWIPDRNRAMLGHGVALAGGALVITVSLRLASDLATPSLAERAFGRSPRHGAARAIWRARWPIAVAVLAVIAGAAYLGRPGFGGIEALR